ncbi:hypothetical protein GCM10022239_13160 [Leifsonia bigeumensis]|uniref:Uncharacterized protein n=1 Tax=Leifsonella bigeumensis TaxID=433643 RepID=A0ABP7FG92_9MICO
MQWVHPAELDSHFDLVRTLVLIDVGAGIRREQRQSRRLSRRIPESEEWLASDGSDVELSKGPGPEDGRTRSE